jgi:hypothetical protein
METIVGSGTVYYDDASAKQVGGSFTARGNIYTGQTMYCAGAYATGDISALTFTDRTPAYEGDALAEIVAIKSVHGEIDHETLPEFAQKTITYTEFEDRIDPKTGKVATETVEKIDPATQQSTWEVVPIKDPVVKTAPGRDIGAMVSILTKAVQELNERIEKLEAARTK